LEARHFRLGEAVVGLRLGAKDGMPALPEAEVWLAVAPLRGRAAVELPESFLIHKLRK